MKANQNIWYEDYQGNWYLVHADSIGRCESRIAGMRLKSVKMDKLTTLYDPLAGIDWLIPEGAFSNG